MEELVKQVADALQHAGSHAAREQTLVIKEASKMVDDLVARGLLDAPSYKLAPLDAVPPKALSLGRSR